MMHPHEHTTLQFLAELKTRLHTGDETYKQYIEHGRSFRYARILKDNNLQISTLIKAHVPTVPDEQRQNVMALERHLDVWHALWDELDHSARHAPDDVFAFENSVNFPKEAVAALLDYLATLSARDQLKEH